MNWKGLGRKQPWPNLKLLSRHSPGGTEEYHKKSQSGETVSGPRFEPGTFRIRSKSANHSTVMYGSKVTEQVN
jgi:hypothetical protein